MGNVTAIDDALHPRMAGSTEGMTLQVLAQIRDSLSAMSRDVRSANEATADVRERVIRLEERDKRLTQVEASVAVLDTRVDVLLKDKDRRDGAVGMLGVLRVWGPVVFSALAALWLFGRSLGITPAPPAAPARVEATIQHDERSIEGTVGGKP
ncbi:hypothetical protein [Sphingomonas sp.]|uniref:hypothetical protein n=1 Tax=Sphingomonas sp. TaxID=28214 RepID=UPI0035C794B6